MINRTAVISDYIDRVAARPFQWGVNDPMMLLAGVVELLTGVDHGEGLRGRYSSCAEGKKLIGMTPLRFVGARLDMIEPVRAVDGDIAAVRQGREFGFGVFMGALIYTMTVNGIGILPRRDAVKAFKVP
jgi:hypothetical protein